MTAASEYLIETPWDERVFGTPAFEIRTLSAEGLDRIKTMKGHFTVKVDPLSSKKVLHDHGFYYCDTLIEPFCTREKFVVCEDPEVRTSRSVDLEKLLAISHGAFLYGRFHRDFNVDRELADLRYDMWLKDLYHSGSVLALIYGDETAGFFGLSRNKIVLHALSEKYRGKGLAKYLWSAACLEMFDAGHREITSSISASNVAALNLYASLGFRFRNPLDVYHLFNR